MTACIGLRPAHRPYPTLSALPNHAGILPACTHDSRPNHGSWDPGMSSHGTARGLCSVVCRSGPPSDFQFVTRLKSDIHRLPLYSRTRFPLSTGGRGRWSATNQQKVIKTSSMSKPHVIKKLCTCHPNAIHESSICQKKSSTSHQKTIHGSMSQQQVIIQPCTSHQEVKDVHE